VKHNLWYYQQANVSSLSQIQRLTKSNSKVDQVKAVMTYSMKSGNKLEGALNFGAWKTRIDLILTKNKFLDIMKDNIMEPQFEAEKEKEP
jgi:hypothetical protein